MGIVAVILIGVALSADAMSVTLANALAHPAMGRARALAHPVLFGLFQGLMPAIGYFAGSLAASAIERVAGPLTLAILGVLGAKMIVDALHDLREGPTENDTDQTPDSSSDTTAGPTVPALLLQAVATSIDALAVGVTLAATSEPILLDASIIAACTFALCCIMLLIGRLLGSRFGAHAQAAGGLILIAIGVKAMLP